MVVSGSVGMIGFGGSFLFCIVCCEASGIRALSLEGLDG